MSRDCGATIEAFAPFSPDLPLDSARIKQYLTEVAETLNDDQQRTLIIVGGALCRRPAMHHACITSPRSFGPNCVSPHPPQLAFAQVNGTLRIHRYSPHNA